MLFEKTRIYILYKFKRETVFVERQCFKLNIKCSYVFGVIIIFNNIKFLVHKKFSFLDPDKILLFNGYEVSGVIVFLV